MENRLNEKSNLLSDEEAELITGGKAIKDVPAPVPAAGTPMCFYGKKKPAKFYPQAGCTSKSSCTYYEDCHNPQKAK